MKKENYLVQPDYLAERKADYDTGEYLNEVFETVSRKEAHKDTGGLSGNVGMDMLINAKTKNLNFKGFTFPYPKGFIRLSEAISSALALYRIICIFNSPDVELDGADGYKSPWFVYFKHKPTEEFIALGEWKGAFGFWSSKNVHTDLPKEVKKDVKKLINLIMSDKSPHPYDKTTAGSVA